MFIFLLCCSTFLQIFYFSSPKSQNESINFTWRHDSCTDGERRAFTNIQMTCSFFFLRLLLLPIPLRALQRSLHCISEEIAPADPFRSQLAACHSLPPFTTNMQSSPKEDPVLLAGVWKWCFSRNATRLELRYRNSPPSMLSQGLFWCTP